MRLQYTYKNYKGSLKDICFIYCRDYHVITKLTKTYGFENAMEQTPIKLPPITKNLFDNIIELPEFKLSSEETTYANQHYQILTSFIERQKITDEDIIQNLNIQYLYYVHKTFQQPTEKWQKNQAIINHIRQQYRILCRYKFIHEQLQIPTDYHDTDTITNDTDDEYINHISKKEMETEIYKQLNTLTKREKKVIELYFGFYDDPKTLEKIAKEMHVTRERIRQILAKGLRKMRHPNRSKILKTYLQIT